MSFFSSWSCFSPPIPHVILRISYDLIIPKCDIIRFGFVKCGISITFLIFTPKNKSLYSETYTHSANEHQNRLERNVTRKNKCKRRRDLSIPQLLATRTERPTSCAGRQRVFAKFADWVEVDLGRVVSVFRTFYVYLKFVFTNLSTSVYNLQ